MSAIGYCGADSTANDARLSYARQVLTSGAPSPAEARNARIRILLHFRAEPLSWMLSYLKAISSISGAYLIAAKASTCSRKSGLDNCGAGTVLLSGEGGPK